MAAPPYLATANSSAAALPFGSAPLSFRPHHRGPGNAGRVGSWFDSLFRRRGRQASPGPPTATPTDADAPSRGLSASDGLTIRVRVSAS